LILDGYPRDEAQAKYMIDTMADKLDGAIILEVPKEELIQRLTLRGRDDDKERESIEKRFNIFEANIRPMVALFEANQIPVERVDGTGKIEEVTARLIEKVRELNSDATEQLNDVNGGEIERSYGE